jgi:flotillin
VLNLVPSHVQSRAALERLLQKAPEETRDIVEVLEPLFEQDGDATRLKAEAFQQYNEAAVIELLVKVLPEIAGRISEPLSKMEKMVIINSGNGPGGGASKLTGDVTQIMAQLPPMLESLTGVKFEKLLEQVPALRKAMGQADDFVKK